MPMIGTGRARRRRWNEKRRNPPSAATTKIPKEMRAHCAAPGATAAIAKATSPDAAKSPVKERQPHWRQVATAKTDERDRDAGYGRNRKKNCCYIHRDVLLF